MPLFKKSMLTLGAILMLVVAATYYGLAQEETEEGETAAAQITEPVQPEAYAVYVCGAVQNPGVVLLSPASRVGDAVNSCGGLLPTADEEKINLAQTIKDGMQITVPDKVRNGAEAAESGLRPQAGGKVNINQADVEELTKIPGVGKATAQRIVDYRRANGPFTALEDLLKIKGIGQAKFEKMAPGITI